MMPRAPRGAHIALVLALALASFGCQSADPIGTACPLLASGSAPGMTWGSTLTLNAATEESSVAPGTLHAHGLWLTEGADVSISALLNDSHASLFLYGPRDARGAFSRCIAAGQEDGEGLVISLRNADPGDYSVVAGPAVGALGGVLSLRATCDNEACGTPDVPPCPTLAERGCESIRCDGELARDSQGCLTCDCQAGRGCGADRSDGPSGTCILPACDCSSVSSAAVCGADGRTWPSACAARCAGVAVAAGEPCDVSCPDLTDCDAPCRGLRTVDPATGCPTCDCAPATPTTSEDCSACSLDESPVCGTDGVTYRNRCVARCAGARILYRAACVEGCRQAPDGCELDCPHGLRLSDSCVQCDCAPAPTVGCVDAGDTLCATFPGLSAPTTVGSPCLANAMGATDGVWGPCGLTCTTDADCPIGSGCRATGALADRCVIFGEVKLGCSALVDYVCGSDNTTYANSCLNRLSGADEAHRGACCEPDTSAPCDVGTARPVMSSGCPELEAPCAPIPEATCVTEEGPLQEACTSDATPVGSVCAAHAEGLQASPTWCLP